MAEENKASPLLKKYPSIERLTYTNSAPAINKMKDGDGMVPLPDKSGSVNAAQDNIMVYPTCEVLDEAEGASNNYQESYLQELLVPLDTSQADTSTTNMQTLMHLIKGNIGTGILALPIAVKHAGLWTGFAGILAIGAIAVHCMHMLIKCSHKLSDRTGITSLDYADAMELCIKTGPLRGRKFSKAARHIVNGFLIFTQLGFCCVYIVFVAANVKTVIDHFYKHGPSAIVYQVIVTAALIPYVLVRNLKMLAPFSTFANILTIAGLIITIQFIVQGLPDVSERPAFSSFNEIPLFFGTAIFAVEGISLVLPLENNMINPEDFGGWTGVLNLGMVGIVCMYTAIGFYGYLQFGEEVQDSVTLSLPVNWLYLSVRLMFAVAIFITYNVQFYVPITIMWPRIRQWVEKNYWLHKYGEFLFRIALVIVTFGISAAIPHLDLLISLIGAFSSSSLALILPAIIEVVTLSGEGEHLPKYIILKDILIFLFGIVGCVLGTYTSLKAIVEKF